MFFCIGFSNNSHNNYCDSQRKVSNCNQIPPSPALLFSWAIFLLRLFFFEVPPLSSCEVLDSVCILCPKEPHHLLHPQLDSLLLPLYGSAVIPSPHPAHHLTLWCIFSFTSTPSAFEPVSLSKPYYLWSLLSLEAGGPTARTPQPHYISGCRTLRRHTELQWGGKPLRLLRHVPALVCKAMAKHQSCNTAPHWYYHPYPHVMVHPAMPAYTSKVSSWQRKTSACLQ